MKDLINQIRKELDHVNDVDLMKVLKRHAGTQLLVTKRITGKAYKVNLYSFNGKYVISDEKLGESFRILITDRQNIAYQIHKHEILYVKSLMGNLN